MGLTQYGPGDYQTWGGTPGPMDDDGQDDAICVEVARIMEPGEKFDPLLSWNLLEHVFPELKNDDLHAFLGALNSGDSYEAKRVLLEIATPYLEPLAREYVITNGGIDCE